MNKLKGILALVGGVVLTTPLLATPAQANTSYCTYISSKDTYNTNGTRLRSVGQIIQQDRANYHKFGNSDSSDGYDGYFTSYNRRVALSRANVRGSSSVKSAILRGDAYIYVDYYSGTIDVGYC